jgi:hypothetical protein
VKEFESTTNSRLDSIEIKFGKQFSSNGINASTSNTENSKDSTLYDCSDLHIPKVPIGVPPIHHMHSRTTIGASTGGGSKMAATNAIMPHTVVHSEPTISAYVLNSSLQHVPNALLNKTSTYSTPQPTINRAPHPVDQLVLELLWGWGDLENRSSRYLGKLLVQSLKLRVGRINDRILRIMSISRTHRDLKYQNLLNLVGMMVEVH